MNENDSMMEVMSITGKTEVYRRISEVLGTGESIRGVLKTKSTNPLVADFVEASFEAVEERATIIEDDAPNVDAIYCIALANALEMFTITIDLLLERKCTATHMDSIANRLWEVWSGLDVAMNICPDRRSWKPPVKAAEILGTMRNELVQSAI